MIVEILLSCLLLTSVYIIWNLIKKQELLETWVEDFINEIIIIDKKLKEVDYKGYFEADDEVGTIFKEIKKIINQLNKFKGQ